jgi:DNA polymerase elongation subunit (family B)
MLPVDSAHYLREGNKTRVKVWRNGEYEIYEADPAPYCFAPRKFEIQANMAKVVHTNLRTIDTGESVDQFFFGTPDGVKSFRNNVERAGKSVYEADIKYIIRWMIDNDVSCSDYPNIAYLDTEEQDDIMPNPETVNVPIIAASLYYKGQHFTFTGNEKQLLTDLGQTIVDQKIQMLGTWNGFTWDDPFIKGRMKMNNVYWDINRIRWLDLMLVYKYSKHASRYSLDFLGNKLGRQKPFKDEKIGHLPDIQLRERVEWDVETTALIDKEYKLSNIAIEMAHLSNLFPDTTLGIKKDEKNDQLRMTVTPVIDSMYFKRARELGLVLPVKKEYRKATEKYKGAHVFRYTAGIFDNVIQLDVNSMYPNIMLAFGLAPYGRTDLTHPIIRKILEGKSTAIGAKRDAWKILANALYGINGSRFTRLRTVDVAEATTKYEREIITGVSELLTQLGYLIYLSDTDSLFVHASYEERQLLQDLVNGWIRQTYGVDNIVFDFKGYWSKIGFPRGAAKADVKKRYYGIVAVDDKGKKDQFEQVGVEAVRGDWSQLAVDVQTDVMKMLITDKPKEDIAAYLADVKTKLFSGLYDNKLTIVKGMRHDISTYKVLQGHVKAFVDALNSGWVPPETMQYSQIKYGVVKFNKPKLSHLIKTGEWDYNWYWNKQILPLMYRLMVIDKVDKYNPKKLQQLEGQTTLISHI